MGAVVFPKYTKVWDNTFGNVLAILTGEYTGWSQVSATCNISHIPQPCQRESEDIKYVHSCDITRQLFRSFRQRYTRTGSNRTTSGRRMTSCGRTSHITTTLRRGLRTGPTFTSSTSSAKPKASRWVFVQVNAFPETIRRLL